MSKRRWEDCNTGSTLGLGLREECKFEGKWKQGHFGKRKNTHKGNLMLGVFWEP